MALTHRLVEHYDGKDGYVISWVIENHDTPTIQLNGLTEPSSVLYLEPHCRVVTRVPVTDQDDLNGLGRGEIRSFKTKDIEPIRESARGLANSYF